MFCASLSICLFLSRLSHLRFEEQTRPPLGKRRTQPTELPELDAISTYVLLIFLRPVCFKVIGKATFPGTHGAAITSGEQDILDLWPQDRYQGPIRKRNGGDVSLS